ncbi:MAG: hypothetical protein HOC71_01750 [Candidatus Latescibacteria bacterium]|jgi:hypothetical protein|nr:hypothetical protein [Candidatus Latescibacterota bacterium]
MKALPSYRILLVLILFLFSTGIVLAWEPMRVKAPISGQPTAPKSKAQHYFQVMKPYIKTVKPDITFKLNVPGVKRKGKSYPSMPSFKPDPDIDYKILKVQVDPTIDYKILDIAPKSKAFPDKPKFKKHVPPEIKPFKPQVAPPLFQFPYK